MNKIILYIILALVATSGSLVAQQIPVFNQYIYNPYVYNPARAGGGDLGKLFVGHKKQWSDLPDAPSTSMLTFELPLKTMQSGMGLTLFNDQTHILSKVGGAATYAYHIPLDEMDEHSFSLGVSAGFLSQRIDFSNSRVKEANDAAILDRTTNSTAFDLGFGAHYHFKRLNIDVSVPQLSNSNVRYLSGSTNSSSFQLISHYLGAVRYEIPVSKTQEFYIEPVAMIRGAAGVPLQYDANLLFKWYNRLFAGMGYRSGGNGVFASGMNASFGLNIQERFMFSYTYEIAGSSINRTSLGDTHEFLLGFTFGRTTSRVKELEEKMKELEDYTNRVASEMDSARVLLERMEDVQEEDKDVDKDMLEQMERLKELQMLQDLRRLQEMKRLQEIQNLLQLDDLQRLEELRNNSTKETTIIKRGDGSNLSFDKVGSVFFNFDASDLSEQSKLEIRRVKEEMESMDKVVTLYIAGNASIEGASTYNLVLSNRRAIAVKNYLRDIGAPESIILPIPYGAENPITKQQIKEEDKKKNRRVDVFILGE
ncbi:PorP/SprF family type IX secretion system membrane protein [bacterium]|nr:PorP/SprF family type IX secretion system membrane protein [bacterium]